MTTVLRRIDPGSLAKVYAAVYGILFLIIALPAGCVISIAGASSDMGGFGAGFGLLAIILYPVFGVIVGYVGGYVSAFVYNLVADRVGGVEMEFDDLDTLDML